MSNISITYPDRATRWLSVAADYLALTKFRIGMLVLVVVAVVAEVAASAVDELAKTWTREKSAGGEPAERARKKARKEAKAEEIAYISGYNG